MPKQVINPPTVHKPLGAYSHSIAAEGGKIIAIAGQVGVDRDGNLVGRGDVREQTRQALRNMEEILKANGASFRDIIKFNVYLTDMRDRAAMNEARREFFGDHSPAGTLVGVTSLAERDLLVEIEALAVV